MTSEERINELETKLLNTLELLKTIVNIDRGLDKDTTDYLVEEIESLQR